MNSHYPLLELSGARLDEAVARAEGRQLTWHEKVDPSGDDWITVVDREMADAPEVPYAPSRSWCDGGPIIERERIAIWQYEVGDINGWLANFGAVHGVADGGIVASERPFDRPAITGPTALVAAMRAYVTRKLGEKVDLRPTVTQSVTQKRDGPEGPSV